MASHSVWFMPVIVHDRCSIVVCTEEQRIQQYHHRSWLRRGLIHDGLVGVGFIGVSLFLYFIGFRRFRHARL